MQPREAILPAWQRVTRPRGPLGPGALVHEHGFRHGVAQGAVGGDRGGAVVGAGHRSGAAGMGFCLVRENGEWCKDK